MCVCISGGTSACNRNNVRAAVMAGFETVRDEGSLTTLHVANSLLSHIFISTACWHKQARLKAKQALKLLNPRYAAAHAPGATHSKANAFEHTCKLLTATLDNAQQLQSNKASDMEGGLASMC